jgi:hypothetical protein
MFKKNTWTQIRKIEGVAISFTIGAIALHFKMVPVSIAESMDMSIFSSY